MFLAEQLMYLQAKRLHVNMGNVHYGAGRLSEALRCWRSGLEALPESATNERGAVLSSIGLGLAQLGRYQVPCHYMNSSMAISI